VATSDFLVTIYVCFVYGFNISIAASDVQKPQSTTPLYADTSVSIVLLPRKLKHGEVYRGIRFDNSIFVTVVTSTDSYCVNLVER